jgi:tetratricopeptide (TPR) repeat protein
MTRRGRALDRLTELGDIHGQANTHDSLGYAYHHLGSFRPTAEHYRQAATMFRQCGDRYLEAETLIRYGETLLAMQDNDSALGAWRHALEILNVLHHPHWAVLRERVDALTGPVRGTRPESR